MIVKTCSFGLFFLLSSVGGSATTGGEKNDGEAAEKCKGALEPLVDALTKFKEAANSGDWFVIGDKLGSDLTPGVCRGKKIPETTGQKIWELAMGVSEPEFRSLALERAKTFLIAVFGLPESIVKEIEATADISFPDRVCSFHNTPKVTILIRKPQGRTDSEPLTFTRSLLLFLGKAKTCLDSFAGQISGRKFIFEDSEEAKACARQFEEHVLRALQGGDALNQLKTFPGCAASETKTSVAGAVFHYLAIDKMQIVTRKLEAMTAHDIVSPAVKPPKDVAEIAKAILFSHPGFFDSPKDNSRGDFIDYLKLTKLLSDTETRPYGVGNKLCEFTFTSGYQVDTNMLNFVRFLEAKILCGKLTLDDVRDGAAGNPPLPVGVIKTEQRKANNWLIRNPFGRGYNPFPKYHIKYSKLFTEVASVYYFSFNFFFCISFRMELIFRCK